MSHSCSDNKPCPCPPHPDLVAHLSESAYYARFDEQETITDEVEGPLSNPTGTVFGINDGQIFPPEHYAPDTPESVIGNGAADRAPLRGAIRVAVVLVDFSDKVMAPGAKQRFQDLYFSTGRIATGSVTEYFKDVSGGLISITGDVIGPYRMPRTLRQYANNQFGMSRTEPNARTLAQDAFLRANPNIHFRPYDNDGNGYVDAFIVVHAGSGAEQTGDRNHIWSLKWMLPTEQNADGVKVYGFLTVPEDARLGVCAHELGHLVFGWPDLYDTDRSSQGIGNWCLMAGGSWSRIGNNPAGTTPCHPSAWCKQKQGWVRQVVETANRSLTLKDIKTPNERNTHRLWTNGNATSREYFLIENRQQTGFDRSLPHHGLLVWHIDETRSNNADERRPLVGLEQADGLNQLAISTAGRGDAGDPYPGSTLNRNFTSTSRPNSRSYAGTKTNVSLTNIRESAAGVVTLRLTVRAPAPVVEEGPIEASL